MVSGGFRFQEVSSFRFQEVSENDSDNDSDSDERRFWLEASTLSNRGEMRQHLPTGSDQALNAGWKPVPQ